MEEIEREPEYLGYLSSQIFVIEDLQYFNNIKKYPDIFLFGIYNFVNVLKEHNSHLAVMLTKAPYDKCSGAISKAIYSNINSLNCNNVEMFEKFVNQFKQQNNTNACYKKLSVSMPIDKMCNDFCQIVLEKNWVYVVASLATFEYVMTIVNKQLNDFILKIKKDDAILLSEENNSYLDLLHLIDCEDKMEIKSGISDTLNLFCVFFNELDNIYFND